MKMQNIQSSGYVCDIWNKVIKKKKKNEWYFLTNSADFLTPTTGSRLCLFSLSIDSIDIPTFQLNPAAPINFNGRLIGFHRRPSPPPVAGSDPQSLASWSRGRMGAKFFCDFRFLLLVAAGFFIYIQVNLKRWFLIILMKRIQYFFSLWGIRLYILFIPLPVSLHLGQCELKLLALSINLCNQMRSFNIVCTYTNYESAILLLGEMIPIYRS